MEARLLFGSKVEKAPTGDTYIYSVTNVTFDGPLTTGRTLVIPHENVSKIRFINCTFRTDSISSIYEIVHVLKWNKDKRILHLQSCQFLEEEESLRARFNVHFTEFFIGYCTMTKTALIDLFSLFQPRGHMGVMYMFNTVDGMTLREVFEVDAHLLHYMNNLDVRDEKDETFTVDFLKQHYDEVNRAIHRVNINTPLYIGDKDNKAANFCVEETEKMLKQFLWKDGRVAFFLPENPENKDWNDKAQKTEDTYHTKQAIRTSRMHCYQFFPQGTYKSIVADYYRNHPETDLPITRLVFAPAQILELSDCGICGIQYDDQAHQLMAIVACGHIVCDHCYKKGKAHNGFRTCPWCRKPIEKVIQLFL